MLDLQAISVKTFYEEHLPQRFAALEVQGSGYTIQHEIDDTIYALRVDERGALDVIPRGVEAPLMAVRMREADWRAVIGGQIEAGTVLAQPGQIPPSRLEKLRELRGRLDLELSHGGEEPWRATMVFNGGEDPAVKLIMSTEDYAALQRGELNSQMAFLSGKLKFEGDLGLLMKLATVIG